METLLIPQGLQVAGKLGLVIGYSLKTMQISAFSEVPALAIPFPPTLAELINLQIQQGFSMKDWIVQHAVQANKLLTPSMQILGLYTVSNEQIIESKSNPICLEIGEVLKRVNKVLKITELIHFHEDLSGKKKRLVKFYNFTTGKNWVFDRIEGGSERIVEIKAKVPVFFEFCKGEVEDFSGILKEFLNWVEGLIIKFNELDKGAVIKSQKALVHSPSFGKFAETPEIRLKGIIESRVVVPAGAKEDFVIAMIKKDLTKSLEDRFSIIKKNVKGVEVAFSLPRRVFAISSLLTSDYLTETETEADAAEHTKTLLGLTPTSFEHFEKLANPPSSQAQHQNKTPFKLLIFVIITVLISVLISLFL